MSQILIIDIQADYQKWISSDLECKIKESTKNYTSIIYLWDNISGDDLYSQIPEDWMLDEGFYDSLNIVAKQYGFLRSFMGIGFDDDEIIKLGKFMVTNKIYDSREIYSDDELHKKYKKDFKNSEMLNYSFESYPVYLPDDLISEIQTNIQSGVVLVGGGRSECLKEISLLLDILDIEHSIHEELTY
jgi:hypothetical protein